MQGVPQRAGRFRRSFDPGRASGGRLGGLANVALDLWADTFRRPRSRRLADVVLSENKCCDHSRTVPIRRLPRLIVRCKDCQVAFAVQLPDPATLVERHNADYFLANRGFLYPDDRPSCFSYVMPRQLFLWSLGFQSLQPHGRRALDVGCGIGIMVRWLDFLGFEGHGVEISPWAVDYAHRELSLHRVRQGTVAEASFPDGHFTLVTLVHVLEHLNDPEPTLREILRILEPGGYLYVESPCSHRDTADYLIPEHLWFYNIPALEYLLSCIGFRELRIGEGTDDPRLHNVPFLFAAARHP